MDNQKRTIGFISLAFLFVTSSSAEFLIKQVTEGRETEYNSSNSHTANLGLASSWRPEPPSSKIVTITSFSVFRRREEPYESSVFEAGGYKWRLVLYVNGNKNDKGYSYNWISLYVRIEETQSLPKGWEVNVDLKLFVKNVKYGHYDTYTDLKVQRYTDANKEWGYVRMVPLSSVVDSSVWNDTAGFGAEIFIVKPVQHQEKITYISNPPNNVFTWHITHFSILEDKFYYSDDFLVEDRYWRLGFNPKGDEGGPRALPLFLFSQGHKPNAVVTDTWVAANLRLNNQKNSNHIQKSFEAWYPTRSGYRKGVNSIISFKDLNDASKGYLVNDAIIFEVEMVKTSVIEIVPA